MAGVPKPRATAAKHAATNQIARRPTFIGAEYKACSRQTSATSVATLENKRLIESAFSELANGNGQPFMNAFADDARWTVIGSSPWSRTYEGKRAIVDELMRPLFRQFADHYTARAIRIIAEDDVVVVEARGQVTTKSGKPYHPSYCYIFTLADGRCAN